MHHFHINLCQSITILLPFILSNIHASLDNQAPERAIEITTRSHRTPSQAGLLSSSQQSNRQPTNRANEVSAAVRLAKRKYACYMGLCASLTVSSLTVLFLSVKGTLHWDEEYANQVPFACIAGSLIGSSLGAYSTYKYFTLPR